MPLDVPVPPPAVEPVARPGRAASAEGLAGKSSADPAVRAFEAAYDEAWLSVFRFALACTNDWPAAEDVVQEAFLALWNRRDEIDWSEPVLPWLLVAARRRATDRFRRLRRAFALRPPRESGPDADERLEWLDVQAAFARLSPLERSALALTSVVDLDAAAAGAALGIEANAVRSAVSRARRKLERSR